MKPFYNTPQLHNPPFEPPQKTGKDLIYHLENKISNYLDDCEKGYCALDKTVLSGLNEELAVAHKSLYHPIIRTEADYETALARINVLMDGDPKPTSTAGEELELLCLLVGNYEAVHYPMGQRQTGAADPRARWRRSNSAFKIRIKKYDDK